MASDPDQEYLQFIGWKTQPATCYLATNLIPTNTVADPEFGCEGDIKKCFE